MSSIKPWYYLIFEDKHSMFGEVIDTFTQKIDVLNQRIADPVQRAEKGIPICIKALTQLQDLVEKHDFEDSAEEIGFFRNIKVIPMSYLVYFSEVRSCAFRIPKTGKDYQKRFLEKELRKINKFFHTNNDFVYYMEQGYSYLDHQFFTRNHQHNFPITPLINYYQYPDFSTSHDMLWAKIQGMYRLIHYVRQSLQQVSPSTSFNYESKSHKLLLWTGSKSALIELIYALYSDRVINDGAVEISAIASSFEDFFNVKLDNIYKTYSEIKARKGSSTKFLEELILKLQQKIHSDDAS